MQPIHIDKFLGLRNTVSEARQPLGALTIADNVLIDDSGAIIRRKGCVKIANGKISSSYGTRDNSAIYLVDNGDLYRFDGAFTLICAGIGEGVCHWAEESASLIFVQSAQRFIAIKNGVDVIELAIPTMTNATVMQGAGRLPEMSVGLTAHRRNTKTVREFIRSHHGSIVFEKIKNLTYRTNRNDFGKNVHNFKRTKTYFNFVI